MITLRSSLALDFAQSECRRLASATDAVVLPEPKPRAIGLLLIMSLIRGQDIRCSQRSDIRHVVYIFQRLDFANGPFNVHPPISINSSGFCSIGLAGLQGIDSTNCL